MTIWRQLFCSATIVKRIRTPFPHPPPLLPHVDLHPITEQDLMISSFHARPLVGLRIPHVGSPGLEWGRGGEVGTTKGCATEKLAPNRHQIISVPLYIHYSFMVNSFVWSRQREYSLYRGTHFKDNEGFEANWMQCEAF